MTDSEPVKLLLDENIGTKIYYALRDLFSLIKKDPPIIAHLVEDFKAGGVLDPDWVPRIASEGWIVISADHALSLICKTHGVTHVIFSGKLHSRPQIEKACAIIEVRNELFDLNKEEKGSAFSLQLTSSGRARLVKKKSIVRRRPDKKSDDFRLQPPPS